MGTYVALDAGSRKTIDRIVRRIVDNFTTVFDTPAESNPLPPVTRRNRDLRPYPARRFPWMRE